MSGSKYIVWMAGMVLFLLGSILFREVRAAVEIRERVEKFPTAVAIFIDRDTYRDIHQAVDAYWKSLSREALGAYLVVDRWENPEAVRRVVRELYRQSPALEGIVLIGDIPIPMIRDAQHLTSAFKMDQERFPWQKSSVPSDRFYDDFDLKFEFLKQDSANPLFFYYSLSPDSPQKIEREIYSARIYLPADVPDRNRRIAGYLIRVCRRKQQQNPLDNVLVMTGHGYISESLTAWTDEKLALREQLPGLFMPGGTLTYLSHAMEPLLKARLLDLLQKPALDLAIFHAHGAIDVQYLLGNTPPGNIGQQVEAIRRFLRGKLRSARRRGRDLQAVKDYYRKKFGVPPEWFAGAFDDSIIISDSLTSAWQDIYPQDLRQIAPRPEVVIFDQCFNGAFPEYPNMAAEYVFGSGDVVVGVANSVNVLQDVWANEGLGLLGVGIRVGLWHRQRNYLETHLIGDPTFRFWNITAFSGDLYPKLVVNRNDRAFWQRLLRSNLAPLRALAIENYSRLVGEQFIPELLLIYRTDPSYPVRLQVLKNLAAGRSSDFEEILLETIHDPYELIRRFSARLMGDVGREIYLPALVYAIVYDPAKRVQNAAWEALSKIGSEKALPLALQELEKMAASPWREQLERRFKRVAEKDRQWLHRDLLPTMKNPRLPLKKRVQAVRTFRVYRFGAAIPELERLAENSDAPAELRQAALEALGWYVYHYRRGEIADCCQRILRQPEAPQIVRREARKTLNRLKSGANYPLTP